MEKNISGAMIQVFEIYRGNNPYKDRGVSWLLKSYFDIFQRDNEKIKVIKKLLITKCVS